MSHFVAFLRAINVGGRVVKMERLRGLFSDGGYKDVKTVIASGNVIFAADEQRTANLEREIEAFLLVALGYEVGAFVRSATELTKIALYDPFKHLAREPEVPSVYIGFLKPSPAAAARARVLSLAGNMDDFHFHDRELHWACRTKISDSAVSGAMLEKKLAMPMTLRNSNTVRKSAAAHPSN